jgi:acetyl-CoA carboxylase biotin carboxylase subunit
VGDKIQSRRIAAEAGVPIFPGSDGVISIEKAIEVAKGIGYPVIVKASGGGGGKGMRIANTEAELRESLTISKVEAMAAFGNPELYIEKYLMRPRHIEFQILADDFGNYIHLGERECSIQRNYQKLIEESPSIIMDEELRKKMSDAAIRIMRSVNYVNAGTVEFLVDEDRNFYFNEANSRLQVEHPVTEMVTGVDLCRQQLIIASGECLEMSQDDIHQNGWSIECRINAEDPDNGFIPSPGIVKQIILPGGPGVRVDTHLYAGFEISWFYDSLVGKLVVWANNRNMAIKRMQRALSEFYIEGPCTTIPFCQKVMQDADFVRGQFDTSLVRKLTTTRRGRIRLGRGDENGL